MTTCYTTMKSKDECVHCYKQKVSEVLEEDFEVKPGEVSTQAFKRHIKERLKL